MANIFETQTLEDNSRRFVIKLIGRFDGANGQETSNTKIHVANLQGALDTNGLIAAGNANSVYLSTYRTTIKRINITVNGLAGEVIIFWASTDPTNVANATIVAAGLGTALFESASDVDVFKNNLPAANTKGDIGLQTLGMVANTGYTVIIEGRKTGQWIGTDYDMGQTADPMAFNAGVRSPRGGTGVGSQ